MRQVLVVDERPLHAGREARAAASAQTRILDHIGHFAGLHLCDGIFERRKTAVLFVDSHLVNVRNITMT